jgi:hypothetical protein
MRLPSKKEGANFKVILNSRKWAYTTEQSSRDCEA